jgi:hypothetical protein
VKARVIRILSTIPVSEPTVALANMEEEAVWCGQTNRSSSGS